MTPQETLKDMIRKIDSMLEENNDYWDINIKRGLTAIKNQSTEMLNTMNRFDNSQWDKTTA